MSTTDQILFALYVLVVVVLAEGPAWAVTLFNRAIIEMWEVTHYVRD